MLKKALLGTLMLGLLGVLVAGAIIRTVDKTGNLDEARGVGQGRGAAQDRGAYGQGVGQAASAAGTTVERLSPYFQDAPGPRITLEGTVVELPIGGGEVVIATTGGEEVTVGSGPRYMEQQGFSLDIGEPVRVLGTWQGSEFWAAEVTRLHDGATITLRDELDRPAWAGAGRRAAGGQGRVAEPGSDPAPALPSALGTGQAEVAAWLTLHGSVVSADADALLVQIDDGSQIVVENRPWWFAREQGFVAEPGDDVTLVGFYEDGEFEVGQVSNGTSGSTVEIREDSGRPLWAGRGRRGL